VDGRSDPGRAHRALRIRFNAAMPPESTSRRQMTPSILAIAFTIVLGTAEVRAVRPNISASLAGNASNLSHLSHLVLEASVNSSASRLPRKQAAGIDSGVLSKVLAAPFAPPRSNLSNGSDAPVELPGAIVAQAIAMKKLGNETVQETSAEKPVAVSPKIAPEVVVEAKVIQHHGSSTSRQPAGIPVEVRAPPPYRGPDRPPPSTTMEIKESTMPSSSAAATGDAENVASYGAVKASLPEAAASKSEDIKPHTTTQAPATEAVTQKSEEVKPQTTLKVADTTTKPTFLRSHDESSSDTCQCHFQAACTCDATMQFMDCIADACHSGKCDCHALQFKHACLVMSETCPKLTMECSPEKAVCVADRESMLHARSQTTEETYEDLMHLKEEKCRLEAAEEDGWLNTKKQLADVNNEIQKHMHILSKRCEKRPEMHCEKHFEEWHLSNCKVEEAKSASRRTLPYFATLLLMGALPAAFF